MRYPFHKPEITKDDREAVMEALKGPAISRGPKVQAFEEAVAAYCGARFAVAFNSGTSALAAAYQAIDLSPFDHLITTPNTFVGTVSGALRLGATLTFADVDPATGNISLEALKEPLQTPVSRGRAIVVPVHYAGQPVDMAALDELITLPNALVIEDAAHAIGATYPTGQRVGCCKWSDMTTFSFNPIKTITTGEGGIVTTNDEALYNRLKRVRNSGIDGSIQEISGNLHLDEMSAALGLSQLNRLDTILAKKKALSGGYRTHLSHLDLLPDLPGSSNYLFVVRVDNRDQVQARLLSEGIETLVHYTPLYDHPALARLKRQPTPHCDAFTSRALSLPLYLSLTEADIEAIGHEVANVSRP